MRFETQYKHGRHWIDCGTREAHTSRGAALMTSYVQSRRVIRVRPEDSRDAWFVYRFREPAECHHGR
jgi:hypothetical protein